MIRRLATRQVSSAASVAIHRVVGVRSYDGHKVDDSDNIVATRRLLGTAICPPPYDPVSYIPPRPVFGKQVTVATPGRLTASPIRSR